MILHITEAKYLKNYQVQVSFNDGRTGIANLKDALYGTVFQSLKDKDLFSQLKLDKELDTITWPNGADFAPEYIYFTAFKDEPELQKQFKNWGNCSQSTASSRGHAGLRMTYTLRQPACMKLRHPVSSYNYEG